MKTSIDNLNKVIWTYSPFIEYLEISKPENIQFLCAKLNNDFEFQNNCHRAIGEITLLYDSNKKELIEKYYNIFKNLNQRLLKWQSEKLENRFYLNYINLALGDLHLYNNHLEQAKLQLSREPKPLPQMKMNPNIKDIFSFTFDDFELVNYEFHPHIKGEVSV